jgi:sulfate adenylyltransferase subunit 2
MKMKNQNALDQLEGEAIHIIREAATDLERLALLFSGGKDSACLLHLASKAFFPAKIPFPLLMVDTGYNFPEVLEFIEKCKTTYSVDVITKSLDQMIANGTLEAIPQGQSRNAQQTDALKEAILEGKYQALLGGARRDEEKARAKERIFSLRASNGTWDPRKQRPELWDLYNTHISPQENLRVFPLSNWTELDVWSYIRKENIPIPKIYFAHKRWVVKRTDGSLIAHSPFYLSHQGDQIACLNVRCRTVGDMNCTGLIESTAESLDDIIREIQLSTLSERATRADDKVNESSMELRKIKGYF